MNGYPGSIGICRGGPDEQEVLVPTPRMDAISGVGERPPDSVIPPEWIIYISCAEHISDIGFDLLSQPATVCIMAGIAS